MNLAILHYHLSSGGVTRVIANHLLSLDSSLREGQRLQALLLFDGQRGGWPEGLADQLTSIDLIESVIPSLGYREYPASQDTDVLDAIRRALREQGFGPEDTVLHAHNHSLGKNAGFPAALRSLAEDGYSMLLQPHDFAEDFRPSNYRHLRESFESADFAGSIYFHGPRVHYATLNRRDFNILKRAGIASERLHFLPNPVPEMTQLPEFAQARDRLQQVLGIDGNSEYVLYPVRGIRRKNVGEFVLLSILRNKVLCNSAPSGANGPRASVFGITLDPQNPSAIPYYEGWRELAGELNLSCRFGVGEGGGLSFPENLSAADRIVTTSVAEGFGMVFLESWLAGRELVGRDLPEITSDFTEAGLQLTTLYDSLNIPIEWVGCEVVTTAVHEACQSVYSDYDLAIPTRCDVADAVERTTANGWIDFGSLDESLQALVIRRVAGDSASCELVLDANPVLRHWERLGEPTISENQQVVENQYSLPACGERLWSIYQTLLRSTERSLDESADGDAILAAFLDLDRFRLIRM